MSLIGRRREALALEHMAQVPPAVGAYNLCAHREHGAVLVAHNGAGNAVKVSGPPAAAAELVRGLVEWRFAAGAGVDALGRVVLVVLPCAGGFSAFFTEHAELL